MSRTYAQDGVNVEAGDSFSSIAKRLCATTYSNSPFVRVTDLSRGLFRGPSPYRFTNADRFDIEASADGVGTKVVLHDALRRPSGAARDLLAMTATDITRWGGLPCVMTNVLDVDSLGDPGSKTFGWFVAAIEELARAATEIGVVLLKGETAELGACIGSDNPNPNAAFNWNSSMTGLIDERRVIYGKDIQIGDVVVALKEDGFRSNGISSVRKALKQHYGDDVYSLPEAEDDIRAAATPSILYDKLLADANGWSNAANDFEPLFDVRLIAHLTGGGLGKFAELLRLNENHAVLDDLFDPPEIMSKCGEWRGVSDQEFYEIWNGGQGALVVMPAYQADKFIDFSQQYGITAKVCGGITRPTSVATVTITSKYQGGTVRFN